MAYKIWPGDMRVIEWFDKMAPYFGQYGEVGRLMDDNEWQNYAANIVKLTSVSVLSVPDPYQYPDWRKWAERMMMVLP